MTASLLIAALLQAAAPAEWAAVAPEGSDDVFSAKIEAACDSFMCRHAAQKDREGLIEAWKLVSGPYRQIMIEAIRRHTDEGKTDWAAARAEYAARYQVARKEDDRLMLPVRAQEQRRANSTTTTTECRTTVGYAGYTATTRCTTTTD